MEKVLDPDVTRTDEQNCTLMRSFCKEVWPCLAVVGGVDGGFCPGGECLLERNGEGVPCVVVSVCDEGKVEVLELTSGATTFKRR